MTIGAPRWGVMATQQALVTGDGQTLDADQLAGEVRQDRRQCDALDPAAGLR
jgi:hypothetical protein